MNSLRLDEWVCGRNSRLGPGVTSGTVLQYVIVLFSRLRILLGTCNHECHNLGSVEFAHLFQNQRRTRRPRSTSRNLFFEHLEDRVTPTTFIWSGLGGNNNWSTAANWQGLVAPTTLANPDVVFNSVTPRLNTTNDISNLSVKSITISASNYTLNGNKLLLNGNVTVEPARPASASLSTCNSPRRPPSRSTTSPT